MGMGLIIQVNEEKIKEVQKILSFLEESLTIFKALYLRKKE
jgi:hypothetical protein